MSRLETTLCILKKENQILLAMKKRGFGAGKYNGIGGKIELNETPEQAMIRETKEEIDVIPTQYEKMGEIEFHEYYKGKKENVIFYLYLVYDWDGIPCESDEVLPKWFDIKDVPYDKMLPDDKYWLPKVLNGIKVNAYFNFDENWNLLYHKIEEINNN